MKDILRTRQGVIMNARSKLSLPGSIAAVFALGAMQHSAYSQELAKQGATLEEVIVTAQKREERLQDVPIPVTVLTADALVSNGATNLQDYYSQVPGLSMRSGLGDSPAVSIRGLSTGGFSNPGVGVTIDDAPYGASTALGGGFQVLDIDPSDLSHIEVLRGPQGTLYGASSIGGLIKFVTLDPSFEGLTGRFSTGAEGTTNHDGLGYSLRGSVNVPLNDEFAIRASAFTRHDNGYIDDPVHRTDGLNHGDSYGGRLAMLWRPLDALSVKVDVLHQHLETDAGPSINAGSTDLVNNTFVPNFQGSRREVTFVTGTVTDKLGVGELTSITAYSKTTADMRNTIPAFNVFAGPPFTVGFNGDSVAYQDLEHVSKFSEELRWAMPLGSHVDWLLGAFYTEERGKHHEYATSSIQSTGELYGTYGNLFDTYYPSNYKEYAAFTDFTVHFTDRFDIQLGARASRNEQRLGNTVGGLLGGGPPFVTIPTAKSSDNATTFLISPQWKITDDLMVYARVADGYRPGGPNYNTTLTPGKAEVGADKTHNYELGAKGDLIGRYLSIDASVYYIRWQDIQVTLAVPSGRTYLANAGMARSKGLELSLQSRPLDGLTLSAWGAWADAYVVGATIPGAQPGEQLPDNARFSGYTAADYDYPISGSVIGSVGTSYNYVGARHSNFGAAAAILPSYSQLDLHAGFNTDGWKVNVYANNVADKRGIVSIDYFGTIDTIIKPRTVGVSIEKKFQ